MSITSSEIYNVNFSIDRKGYDVDEVDVFLEHVAEEIDNLNNQIAELEAGAEEDKFSGFDTVAIDAVEDDSVDVEEDDFNLETEDDEEPAAAADESEKDARIKELERQLEEKRADGNAIAQALIIAQRSADDLLAKAHADADDIVAAAKEEAAAIIAQANADKQEIQDEMDKMDEDCEAMRENFQSILRGFITDSTDKLAEIGDASLKNSAHARAKRPASTWVAPEPAATAAYEPVAEQAELEPEPEPAVEEQPAFVAAETMVLPMEKDLSGFGDAAVDDFDFDDLD